MRDITPNVLFPLSGQGGGGGANLESKAVTVTENGSSTIAPSAGYDGISYVDLTVDVEASANLEQKTVTVTENGSQTLSPSTGYDGISSVSLTVNVPTSGGSPVEEKTVNFIDFDGTLVASYTGEEAQALSALPNAPDHSSDVVPLTFDQWNWTLAEIKSYNTNNPDATIWVGANYHTTDGKTHLFFEIATDNGNYGVGISTNKTVNVDWGDGSTSSGGVSRLIHVYQQSGLYHCVVDGCEYVSCGSNSDSEVKYGIALVEARLSAQVIRTYNNECFCRCFNLRTVSLPNSITSFGDFAFRECYNLRAAVIPKSAITIGSSLFQLCNNLQRLSLPDSMPSTGSYLVSSCPSLRSITIPSNLTTVGDQAFAIMGSLQKAIVPNGITSINFSQDPSLRYVKFPNSVTDIGRFYQCYSLKDVIIPPNVTEIKNNAFYSCYSLESITIPAGVTSIGSSAFSYCYSLYTVIMLPTTPPTLGNSSVFSTSRQQHIYVPAESVEAYKTATNWSSYASIIEAMPSA